MFRVGVRRFTTTTWRASQESSTLISEASRHRLTEVSKAQGIANQGLVDGNSQRPHTNPAFLPSSASPSTFPLLISQVIKPNANKPRTAIGKNATDPAQVPLRGNRLHDSRQSRVPKPRRLRQGPRGPVRGRERRTPWPAQARRDRRRGHSRQHRHRARARVPVKGLPARHIHAQHPVAGQDRPAPAAGRTGPCGARGTVREPGQLQPPGQAAR